MAKPYLETVKAANAAGWKVLNTFQLGSAARPVWRVNLQKWIKGASTDHFTEYCDDFSLDVAAEGAWEDAQGRDATLDKRAERRAAPVVKRELTERQEKRLERAMGDLWAKITLSASRAGSDDREDDYL